MLKSAFRFAAIASVVAATIPAQAADLTIGVRAEPAVDPHFLYANTNIAYSRHIFGALTDNNADSQAVPGLAVSWRPVDDKTWEFKLRPGVKFHDGEPFTAADVIFTFNRVPNIPNNPNPYNPPMRSVASVDATGPLTVIIKTKAPDPVLPASLSNIFIVSHDAAEGAMPADFKSGKAAIGTGPYKFVEFKPGDRLVLEKNPDFWGPKEPWDKVTFRMMSNDAARVAALLAGDVDMIGAVGPGDVARLEQSADIDVFKRPSDRIIYLIIDVARDKSPFITAKDGSPLGKNPLKDAKVRKALSMAIDRDAITSKIMGGLAEPASQFAPAAITGYDPSIPAIKYDPNGAKALLAEAGWGDGFGITIHGPNNRYVYDFKVVEAVGQMWARLGLKVEVFTEPMNVYFPKISVAKGVQYSAMLMGWGHSSTGDTSRFFTTVLHSYDKARKFGPGNRSGYKDPVFDALIEDAVGTLDPDARVKKLRQAMTMAVDANFSIPLHTQFTVMAARKGIKITPRLDESTVAMSARPAS